jgi:hypothetical protein
LSDETSREAKRAAWKRYGFAIVPAVAVLEIGAHIAQATSKIPEKDWVAAREAVRAIALPEDLVAFAPRWVDPIGRSVFKDEIATVEREARPDDTRFPRAIEVGIRGAHLREFDSWRVTDRKRVGTITLTTYENPAPAKVIDDLVSLVTPDRATVARVDGGRETGCPFVHGRSQSGNIGFGPGVPADRFACQQGGFVGVSVMQALDYLPHRCIYAPPLERATVLRIRFSSVRFGKALHGHHAISWDTERKMEGAPVTIAFKVGDQTLGKFVHSEGDSWKPFEVDTSELEGQTAELVADITTPNAAARQYCFEADTR